MLVRNLEHSIRFSTLVNALSFSNRLLNQQSSFVKIWEREVRCSPEFALCRMIYILHKAFIMERKIMRFTDTIRHLFYRFVNFKEFLSQ